MHEVQQAVAERHVLHGAEDPPLEVARHEQIRPRSNISDRLEEQVAVVAEREVEVPEHASLRLRREVHERVVREDQRDARDRGIDDEVVPPEMTARRISGRKT